MISCDSFRKKLNDYMEGSLSMDMNDAMEKHMKECRECRRLYEEERKIDDIFTEALSSRNLQYNSIRNEILKGVDKKRYNRNFGKKVYFSVRKNYQKYISGVAAMILVFVSVFYMLGLNKGGVNPQIRQKQTEFKLPSPDTIILSDQGKQRMIGRDDAEYSKILEMMNSRFGDILNLYSKDYEPVFKEIESEEIYVEFQYNSAQSLEYEGKDGSAINGVFMRLIMPLTGDKNNMAILGTGSNTYIGMIPLVGLKSPSSELISMATEVPPVKEEDYQNFKEPEEIWFYRSGEKRIVRKDNPLFDQILKLTDERFGNRLNQIYKGVTLEDIEHMKSSQLVLELKYSDKQTLQYKTSDDKNGKAEYDRLLMPLEKDGDIVVFGGEGKYLSGPLAGLSPSEELETLLTSAIQFNVEALSLSPKLLSIYKKYEQQKDDNLLRGLDPVDICKLYYHAEEKFDYETMYALYVKFENGENVSYPDLKTYLKDIKSDKNLVQNSKNHLKELKEQTISIEQIPIDLKTTAIQFTFKSKEIRGGGFETFMVVKDKNGIWKANWMPIQ